MPASICAMRPATRTIKNSSRLEPTMERKLTRSSNGFCSSSASSSTRRWNDSRLSSRLRYRLGSLRLVEAGEAPGGGVSVFLRFAAAAAPLGVATRLLLFGMLQTSLLPFQLHPIRQGAPQARARTGHRRGRSVQHLTAELQVETDGIQIGRASS